MGDKQDLVQQMADSEERRLWIAAREQKEVLGRIASELQGNQSQPLGQQEAVAPRRVAARFNQGKPQLHYADTFPEALDGVSRVSAYGASKYSPYNYKKGAASAMESYNAMRRHMKAWLNGEDMVPDSPAEFGVKHVDAIIWNCMRLAQELVDFPERDDRPHKVLAREESK